MGINGKTIFVGVVSGRLYVPLQLVSFGGEMVGETDQKVTRPFGPGRDILLHIIPPNRQHLDRERWSRVYGFP